MNPGFCLSELWFETFQLNVKSLMNMKLAKQKKRSKINYTLMELYCVCKSVCEKFMCAYVCVMIFLTYTEIRVFTLLRTVIWLLILLCWTSTWNSVSCLSATQMSKDFDTALHSKKFIMKMSYILSTMWTTIVLLKRSESRRCKFQVSVLRKCRF